MLLDSNLDSPSGFSLLDVSKWFLTVKSLLIKIVFSNLPSPPGLSLLKCAYIVECERFLCSFGFRPNEQSLPFSWRTDTVRKSLFAPATLWGLFLIILCIRTKTLSHYNEYYLDFKQLFMLCYYRG